MNRLGLSILPCAFAIITLQCTQPSQLVTTGGSEVVGKLVTVSNNPVPNAKVFAYKITTDTSAADSIPVKTVVSNEKGEYTFSGLDAGLYNFFGIALEGGDTLRSSHPNIHNDSLTPRGQPPYRKDIGPDTMHAPGKIRGRVILEPGDSTPITCYIPGSSFISISDDTGAFIISSVPPGVYRLYYADFKSDRYQSAKDSGIVVYPDSVTKLKPKVLVLSTIGAPPAPKGVTVSYDTVSGQVSLSWNKVNVGDLKDYIIYRRDSAAGSFLPINTVQKPDTVFKDKVYTNPSDTSNHIYAYELASEDSGNNISNSRSDFVVDTVVSPSTIRTFVSLIAENTANDTIDTAGVLDNITIIASYTNKSTIVRKLFWSMEKPDSVVDSAICGSKTGTVTLRKFWTQTGIKTVYVTSLDDAGRSWTDSIRIFIVQDTPIVKYLSPDITIDYGGTVQCSIAVAHRFGLCTLSVDLNHDSKYEVRRLGLVFDTAFSTGLDTSWGKVKIRITDTHKNSLDTFFTVTIRPQLHNIWVNADTLSVARRSISTAVLNGTLYAIGGCWDRYSASGAYIPQAYSRVEAYDTVLNKWTLKDSLRNARYECVSAVVNGKIYVIGGRGNRGAYVNTIEEYDTGTYKWVIFDTLLVSRAGSACCMLGNTLYIFGGITGNFVALDSIYSYDITAKKWSGVGKMQQPRYDFQAVAVDGNAYLFGGYSDIEATLGSVEIFSQSSGQTTLLNGGQMEPRSNFAATTIKGSIYVFGGLGSTSPTHPISDGLTSVSKYDSGNQQWTQLLDLQYARYYFSAEVINGRIYCIGGATGPFDKPVAEKSTLIYYP